MIYTINPQITIFNYLWSRYENYPILTRFINSDTNWTNDKSWSTDMQRTSSSKARIYNVSNLWTIGYNSCFIHRKSPKGGETPIRATKKIINLNFIGKGGKMQDLMMDIFILCMLLNQREENNLSHEYTKDSIAISKRINGEWYLCTARSIERALTIKNYLETILNGEQGDESIWE